MSAPVPSVVHALAIVRTLAAGEPLTLSEVAQACAISPSSCLGILRTLVGEGVLAVTSGKRYALQAPWSAIARDHADEEARLLAQVRPLLERAARRWEAPIGLWRIAGRDRMRLAALGQSAAATRIHMEEGQRQPIGGGAVGRALAAAQRVNPAELARRHAAVRWDHPVAIDDYARQVEESARRGYADDDGLVHAGIASLAVGVADGPRSFCLSASVFAGSRRPDDLAALGTALAALRDDILRRAAPSTRTDP